MATSDGSTTSSMISLKSVSAAPTNVPYIIDLTTQEFRPTKATRQRKPVTPQRTKSPKATNADHLVTPTSNLQIFTIDAPRKVPQITVRRKPVSPASVERPGSGLDLTLSETSAPPVPPPDSFARYMSAFADQSMHVQFNIPRNRPLSRPGTSRSFRAPRDLDVPSRSQLQQAALLSVVGQRGERISFGELFQKQKTLVIFIRHFWCPLCQDYMASVSRSVSPEMLKRAGVKLVIISNGSHKMIRSYRKIFRTPFQVYTDPTHRVYDALGMTTEVADEFTAPGGYVRHGVFSGIAMVVANALKVGMPVWERGGDISRLGGEFILGPGITCSFAHRMQNPRSHAPIMRLIAEVGVDVATPEARSPSPASKPPNMTEEEEMQWMKGRRRSLAALKARKVQRRGGSQWCGGSNCLINVDSKEST
ncbi:hypothetical protein PC9H_007483 [Pleurotus ostreatus]|uniref:Uncharacterized protein n=2 Tax=Pleurotus ostreatus TaxID=5322 RepID=A0A8H6ZY82_PLEOS|nr:uncharacterized protein PC9H_007483 [Pleurotus ostreatus]KAF7428262.1 hypothetical protein PC9H_007483 [Pleurotus ostreatus]